MKMGNNWMVVTESDGMKWLFETYEEANDFLDSVKAFGEKATLNYMG
jgi:hypothetical protein